MSLPVESHEPAQLRQRHAKPGGALDRLGGCLRHGAAGVALLAALIGGAAALYLVGFGAYMTIMLRDPYDLENQRWVLEAPEAVLPMLDHLRDAGVNGAATLAAAAEIFVRMALTELAALAVLLVTTPARTRVWAGSLACRLARGVRALARRLHQERRPVAAARPAAPAPRVSRWTASQHVGLAAALTVAILLAGSAEGRLASRWRLTIAARPRPAPVGQLPLQPARVMQALERGWDDYAQDVEGALGFGLFQLALFSGSLGHVVRSLRARHPPG
jgi:hypothetical protein